MSEKIKVNVRNFIQADTYFNYDRMMSPDGVNLWAHQREPWRVDKQTVVRVNRDCLFSMAVVDISKGATLTLPEAESDRYVSVMVVNQDHYINRIFHKGGTYQLTIEEYDTPFVFLAARILVNSLDEADIKIGNDLQDALKIEAASAKPFVVPDYDMESYQQTREPLLALGLGLEGLQGMFGSKEEVDPVIHLIGTAFGWGGQPSYEAFYETVDPELPPGEYQITLKDVPCDAFWSVTVYNKDGVIEENDRGFYNINSVNAERNADGSVTVHFGGCEDSRANCFPIFEGWNYLVRYYRPHKEVIEGKWVSPKPEPVKL